MFLQQLLELREHWSPQRTMAVFYARGIDGLNSTLISAQADRVATELHRVGLIMLDPWKEVPRTLNDGSPAPPSFIVEKDLELLAKASAVLMDLSLPGRAYIGCSCELVYAKLMRIPVVAFVGKSDNDQRIWLQYHASVICKNLSEAVDVVVDLSRDQRVQ